MAVVRVKSGAQKGKVFDFGEKPLVVGRDPGEGAALMDASASRRHAEFFTMGEMCFVRDLGSKNGTLVNDKKIDGEELLKEGDRIRVGETILVYEMASAPGVAAPEFMGEEDKLSSTLELQLGAATTISPKPGAPSPAKESALEVLCQATRALSSLRETKPLLSKTLELAFQAAKAETGYLFVRDEAKKGSLTCQASQGQPAKVSGSIVRRAMQESRAILTSEAMADFRFKEQASVVMHRIGPVLCAPLVSHETARGVIYLTKRAGSGAFDSDLLELVASIGLQAGLALENVIVHEQRRSSVLQMLRALVSIMEIRDPEAKGHAERVAAYSLAIAKHLGLPEEEAHRIQLAALLHDVGKIAVKPAEPELVLGRKASTNVRMESEHVILGEKMLEKVPAFAEFTAGVTFHHERMDGSGFPRGSKGDEIPMVGRIVMVANWYDTMSSAADLRKRSLSTDEIFQELESMAGKQFDAHAAKALLLAHRSNTLYAPETLYDEGWTEAV